MYNQEFSIEKIAFIRDCKLVSFTYKNLIIVENNWLKLYFFVLENILKENLNSVLEKIPLYKNVCVYSFENGNNRKFIFKHADKNIYTDLDIGIDDAINVIEHLCFLYPSFELTIHVEMINECVMEKQHSYTSIENDFLNILKKFDNGIDRSFLGYKKFIKNASNVFNEENFSQKSFEENIDKYCVRLGKKYYLLELFLNKKDENELILFIENSLNQNKVITYFSIAKEYPFLNDIREHWCDLFKYLAHKYKKEWELNDDSILLQGADFTTIGVIRQTFEKWNEPLSAEEIVQKNTFLKLSTVKNSLAFAGHKFIKSFQKDASNNYRYFPISMVSITDDESEMIAHFLESSLEDRSEIRRNELTHFLKSSCSDFVERNEYLMRDDVNYADYVGYKFCQIVQTRGVIISKGYRNSNDVIIEHVKKELDADRLTYEGIFDFCKDLGTSCQLEKHVYPFAVRIDENKFLSKDKIEFDVEAIDDFLLKQKKCVINTTAMINTSEFKDSFFKTEYVVYWNKFLLESFLFSFSKRYELKIFNFSTTKTLSYFCVTIHDSPKSYKVPQSDIVWELASFLNLGAMFKCFAFDLNKMYSMEELNEYLKSIELIHRNLDRSKYEDLKQKLNLLIKGSN